MSAGQRSHPNARDRFQGFVDAMRESGIEVDGSYPYVFNGHFTIEGGIQAVDYLFSFTEQPTAILFGKQHVYRRYYAAAFGLSHSCPGGYLPCWTRSNRKHAVVRNVSLQRRLRSAGNRPMWERQFWNVSGTPAWTCATMFFEPSLQHGNSIAPPSSTLSEKLPECCSGSERASVAM